ncbi:uncharacterized protein LOC117764819 [Hippoglossus hippoglossus]|uniref:uncharacterized protein LOC117764819 n=1 Tax=Hippoglossus hippoglossus TaxID=8267 RepID=UPI00148CAC7A|nr:uncharacterized protein LOC117764819 [Hippoglossus hippoglossus]
MTIARVLEQAKAISQVLSGDRYARSLIPTWQDIDVLESIHKALHPLLEFTDALSGEEYVSISYLKPVLHLFATSVLAEDAEDTDLTKSIKTKVLAYLNNKYGDPNIQELLDVACFLDPRFKTQFISTDNIPAIKTRLKTEMVDLAKRTYHRDKRSRTETVPQSAQPLGEKAKRSLGSFFKTSAASPSLPVKPEDAAEAEDLDIKAGNVPEMSRCSGYALIPSNPPTTRMKRSYPSGCGKRKKQEEGKKVLATLPKVSTFFRVLAGTENNIDKKQQEVAACASNGDIAISYLLLVAQAMLIQIGQSTK